MGEREEGVCSRRCLAVFCECVTMCACQPEGVDGRVEREAAVDCCPEQRLTGARLLRGPFQRDFLRRARFL